MRPAVDSAVGSDGPGSIAKYGLSAAMEVDVGGEVGDEPVDRLDEKLFGGQLDHEGHHEVMAARLVPVLLPYLFAKEPCGFVAMVPVGEHDRLGADELGDPRDRRGIGDRGDLVDDAFVIGGREWRVLLERGRGGGRRNPSASESPQIGEVLMPVARSRSSRSPFGFGIVRSWGRTSPPPSTSTPSAPITPTVARSAPVSSVKRIR